MLIDSLGRKLNYLRVSITDRCNLRCVYCMPPEGVPLKPHDEMLRFEEILRLCRILASLGISRIRVTGGEPLVRRGAASFLKSLKEISSVEKLFLTTNGCLLGAYLDEVDALGPASLPDGINISLDALSENASARITRRDESKPLNEILPHVDRLLRKNIQVKINCVPVRGYNEGEIVPLASLAKYRNIAVRFIELMPMGSAADFEYIPGSEIATDIEKAFGKLEPCSDTQDFVLQGSGPAVYYSLAGFIGKIGFINPMSHNFCRNCNRLRLTSEGKLKLCLSSDLSLDLKEQIRAGVSDREIADSVSFFVKKKPGLHTFAAEIRSEDMSRIGG